MIEISITGHTLTRAQLQWLFVNNATLFTYDAAFGTITAMEMIQTALPYVQIVLAVLLIATVLLQQRGSSIGGAFGGDNFSATFHKRRGGELFLFRASIILATAFVLSALLNIVI